MFSIFCELVKKIGIFIIIGQTISKFGVSIKYERYLKIVISFIVVAQIVFAFGVYLKQEKGQWLIMSPKAYLKEWDEGMQKVEKRMEEKKENAELKTKEAMKQPETGIGQEGNINERVIVDKIVIP